MLEDPPCREAFYFEEIFEDDNHEQYRKDSGDDEEEEENLEDVVDEQGRILFVILFLT